MFAFFIRLLRKTGLKLRCRPADAAEMTTPDSNEGDTEKYGNQFCSSQAGVRQNQVGRCGFTTGCEGSGE
ncbi:hypothetical protein B9H02_11450 [Prosthecochloris sp. HL-130-GSB]|jgi:hypothetical protein|nr:hypothetical protein B9H02_11450 [Prosthecochloris sp. HL-130-GSB]